MRTFSTPVETMHASIVTAIGKIQASLGAVHKSQKNQHGGYHFASTDDIYAALTKKMGEVGLVIMPLEIGHEIVKVEKEGKTVQWLKAEFGFILATTEATWHHPSAKRSLYIQVTGPQTHQAAQSYAEKAFLRSLFKLPTGDMDLDSMPQGESEDDQVALAQPKKRKSSYGAKKDGTSEVYNEIRSDVATALNAEHLQHVRNIHNEAWQTLPAKWVELLDQEYEDKMDSFGAREAAQ